MNEYEYEALLEPLTPQVFYILLAVIREPLHGYGIRERVRADSGGAVVLADGTLYPALKRLSGRGWIEEAGREPVGPSEKSRLHYQLTSTGLTYLRSEICRLNQAADIASRRLRARDYISRNT